MNIIVGRKLRRTVSIILAGTISISFAVTALCLPANSQQNQDTNDSGDTSRILKQAQVLESRKKFAKAIPLRNNVADLYRETGQFEKAIEQYKKIVSLCEQYKSSKPHTKANAYKNIGECLTKSGYAREAESYYKKMVSTQRLYPGKQNTHYIDALNTIANYYQYKLRQPHLGVPYVEVIVNLERKSSITSTTNVKRLADLYMSSRMYNKAAPMWNYLIASEKNSRNQTRKNGYLLQYAICQTKLRQLKIAGPIFKKLKSNYENSVHRAYGEVLPLNFLSAYVEYLKVANLSDYETYNARLRKINQLKVDNCPACGRG